MIRPYPELTVGAFIVDAKGRILLVVSPKWGYKYSIPGGHVLHGEKVFDAVVREAAEEVGLQVEPVEVIAFQEIYNPAMFYRKNRHFIFVDVLCKAISTDVKTDGAEVHGHIWVSPAKALKLPLEKYTKRLIRHYLKSRRVNRLKFFSEPFRAKQKT
ncbi:MAG: NUDIX domain-containing protein [Candidatus Caldarchaeum sp.]|nr:NUDIX domain-containing protein [Candidatus Caldarchaeum sp.]MDW7978152.1 NUDIX domain-containing protein [Candidatus Caldarchaeum sp.]MDW8360097.1 NUDIX domain-containing protein [Candidatus Caldarchaeum sp.]